MFHASSGTKGDPNEREQKPVLCIGPSTTDGDAIHYGIHFRTRPEYRRDVFRPWPGFSPKNYCISPTLIISVLRGTRLFSDGSSQHKVCINLTVLFRWWPELLLFHWSAQTCQSIIVNNGRYIHRRSISLTPLHSTPKPQNSASPAALAPAPTQATVSSSG